MKEIKQQIKSRIKDVSPEFHEFLRQVKYNTYAAHKIPQPPLRPQAHPISKLPLNEILALTEPVNDQDEHLLA